MVHGESLYSEDFIVTVSFDLGEFEYGFPTRESAVMFARGASAAAASVWVYRWDFDDDCYVKCAIDCDASLFRV